MMLTLSAIWGGKVSSTLSNADKISKSNKLINPAFFEHVKWGTRRRVKETTETRVVEKSNLWIIWIECDAVAMSFNVREMYVIWTGLHNLLFFNGNLKPKMFFQHFPQKCLKQTVVIKLNNSCLRQMYQVQRTLRATPQIHPRRNFQVWLLFFFKQ